MAAVSPAAPPAAVVKSSGLACSRCMRRRANAACVGELSSFGGLKAHNGIASLGLPECADRSFARVVSSLRAASRGRSRSSGGGGGALSSTCSASSEIFRIAAIMNGLVLVGVAIGFVLLRVEAWLEESE